MSTRAKLNLILLCLFCTLWEADAQTIVEPLGREVALAGEIKEVRGYGPPGYGEDKKKDKPIIYWVVELPNPIDVLCTPEKPEWSSTDCKATKRLRLIFPILPEGNDLELKVKAMKGRQAIVSGVLHRQDTVGEMTPIYMDVTDVQAGGSAKHSE